MSVSSRTAAACAAAATLFAAPALAGGSDLGGTSNGGTYHIYRTPEMWQKLGRWPNLGTGGQMLYYGGSVFGGVKVVSVMWGPNVSKATVDGMPAFLKAMVNSTYVDQLSPQYDTELRGQHHWGTHQDIKRGTFLGQVTITPENTNTQLLDYNVQEELKDQIAKGVLPPNDHNTLYMIYFPSNVTINLGGLISCQAFGAYHFATNTHNGTHKGTNNSFYGVMPDCGYTFTDHTIISSHEFSEATTDNRPTPGSSPAFPQAWNTSNGYEIGDLCEGTSGTLTDGSQSWQVQQEYLNTLAGCSTGNFTSP